MSVLEVGWPTGIAISGRVAVERFAMLVSAVGAAHFAVVYLCPEIDMVQKLHLLI